MRKELRYIFFILSCFVFNNLLYGQIYKEKQIDSILEISKQGYVELNHVKSIEFADRALNEAIEINYTRGIAVSNIYLAKVLVRLGEYNGGLKYLAKVKNSKFFKTNNRIRVDTYWIRGRIFARMELYKMALKEFYKQLYYSKNFENLSEQNTSTFLAQQNLSYVFNKLKIEDSLKKYLVLQEKSLVHLNESQFFLNLSYAYCQFSRYHISKGDFFKARGELEKSKKLLKKNNSRFLFATYTVHGELEEALGNIEMAENYYKKALINAKEVNDKGAIINSYKVLADFFTKHKPDSAKATNYYINHNKYKDSLQEINYGVLQRVWEHIEDDTLQKQQAKIDKYNYGILLIIIFIVLLIFFIMYTITNYKKLVKKKELDLLKKEKRISFLRKQIEVNRFDELMTFANSNDVGFLPLFMELYPNEIERLKEINPKISTSEISFFAYAFLNFSAKNIAHIQCVTLRAVQVRKNRIRKKYNIPSDADFNMWVITKLSA